MKIKTLRSLILIALGLLILTPVLFAGQPAVWIEGSVTRAPWIKDAHHMIEVDWKPYKVLSDIRITYRYLRNKGAYDEKQSHINLILPGQKIMMKVRKKDVVQIILF